MLSVKTNKNIDSFKSTFLGGFDLKESVAIIISTVLGVVINLLLMFFTNIPKILIVYIPIAFIALPLILVFYKKDGMGYFKHKKIEKEFKNGKPLEFISTENYINYRIILKNNNSNKNFNEINEKKFKTRLKIIITLSSLLLSLIIVLIIYFLIRRIGC